jgi:hypothetical protein
VSGVQLGLWGQEFIVDCLHYQACAESCIEWHSRKVISQAALHRKRAQRQQLPATAQHALATHDDNQQLDARLAGMQ